MPNGWAVSPCRYRWRSGRTFICAYTGELLTVIDHTCNRTTWCTECNGGWCQPELLKIIDHSCAMPNCTTECIECHGVYGASRVKHRIFWRYLFYISVIFDSITNGVKLFYCWSFNKIWIDWPNLNRLLREWRMVPACVRTPYSYYGVQVRKVETAYSYYGVHVNTVGNHRGNGLACSHGVRHQRYPLSTKTVTQFPPLPTFHRKLPISTEKLPDFHHYPVST
jgi:hypothetical protein